MIDLLNQLAGRTISKVSAAYLNPEGHGPMMISVECEDGSGLSVVTDQRMTIRVKHSGLPMQAVAFTPILMPPKVQKRRARR